MSDSTTQPPGSVRRAALSRGRAALLVTVAVLAPAPATAGYLLGAGNARVDVVGPAFEPRHQPWPPTALADSPGQGWVVTVLLVLGVAAGLLAGLSLARHVFWTPQARAVERVGRAAALTGSGAALVAVGALAAAVATTQPTLAVWLRHLHGSAVVLAVVAVAVAAAVAVTGIVVTLGRLASHRRSRLVRRPAVTVVAPPPLEPGPLPFQDDTGAAPVAAARTTRWANAYVVPGISQADLDQRRPDRPEVGFCLSGGGIRSATVALGALQVLRERLLQARWLVSVSGGGYTAGALQLALQEPHAATGAPAPGARRINCPHCWMDGDRTVAEPRDALGAGSLEEDHLRRHSHYLADDAKEWLVALAVVLRGLVVSLLLTGSTMVAAGLTVSAAYAAVPLADLAALEPKWLREAADGPLSFPAPRPAVVGALVLLLLAAVAAYVGSLTTGRTRARTSRRRAATRLSGLALLLAGAGVLVPAVVWLSAAAPVSDELDVREVSVGGSVGTVVLTYAATLAATAWRHRTTVTTRAGMLLRRGGKRAGTSAAAPQAAVPQSVLERLVVLAVLVALAAVHLLLFGWVASTGHDWPLAFLVSPFAVLLLVGLCVDQTRLGLHPFYRRRLATAFAVRRVRRSVDDRLIARPYCYDHERTSLSTYAARVQRDGRDAFPELVFAAAANLSGSSRTPPGRRAVGFCLSGRYVGGPDVGWVDTRDLETVVPPEFGADLTVQAAVALSGAAFASAMGRQARPIQSLLALSNARLGAWLPNPAFLEQWAEASRGGRDGDWTMPGLPRIRRLTYLLREVAGSYLCNDRLLFITDGGHYENLGLVELLRRRSTDVYCIDASGDAAPVAGTLAEAIALAYDELGVRVELEDSEQWGLVPGSADPLPPPDPLAGLNGRLAKRGVVRGTLVYPAESGLPEQARRGRITVLKATLTPDLPYSLLSYAVGEPVFPNDSTADQWFGHDQFTGYHALGRALAEQLLREEQREPQSTGAGPARAASPPPPPSATSAERTTTTETVRQVPLPLPLARDGRVDERATGLLFVRRSIRRD